jgi:lipopolysaccharide/colanic/teichoic acid biosynthesis glycosyltransferase
MLESSIEYLHYRNMIKPGITGWAQVKQGYVDTADASIKKLMYDLYYVQNFGIMLDLEIMVKTAFIMIARIGAR